MNRKPIRPIALALLGLLSSFAGAQSNPLENFDFKTVKLKKDQLKDMGGWQLSQVRAIIFGRHGRIFKDPDLDEYLQDQPWYKPKKTFSNAELNDTERANLDIVREAEANRHFTVQPGDLRFWQNRLIKAGNLRHKDEEEDFVEEPTMTDLNVMVAEIEAIHGKRFPDSPMLQRYFDDRYWYHAAAKYDASSLNKFERANLKFLRSRIEKGGGQTLAPEDMGLYDNKPIPSSKLKGMNLHDLRVARNWIYAARGAEFKTEWLDQYFSAFDWYAPATPPSKTTLTKVDYQNLGLILRLERDKHEALSTKLLKKQDLHGMFVEDLKKLANEIPARHGKVFKDKWLASYFGSMPWYKANPAYSDKLLTSIERKNLAFILKAQASGQKQFDIEEG